jgi:hypothetical protein
MTIANICLIDRIAGAGFFGIDVALTLRFIRNFDACD